MRSWMRPRRLAKSFWRLPTLKLPRARASKTNCLPALLPRALRLVTAGVILAAELSGLPVISQDAPESLIRSADWQVRRKGFAQQIGADPEAYSRTGAAHVTDILDATLRRNPATADALRTALIQLLEVENATRESQSARFQRTGKTTSEEYLNYYGDVVAAVASLHDPRSLNALIGAATTGGMAEAALVGFGPAAIDPIVEKQRSQDPLMRATCTRILSRMLVPPASVQPTDRLSVNKIRTTLFRAAIDPNFIVRMNAVEGLVRIGDPKSIEVVERIARNDPYEATFIAKGKYPVREAAKRALRLRSQK